MKATAGTHSKLTRTANLRHCCRHKKSSLTGIQQSESPARFVVKLRSNQTSQWLKTRSAVQLKISGVVRRRLRSCHRRAVISTRPLSSLKSSRMEPPTLSLPKRVPKSWQCTERAQQVLSWLAKDLQNGSFLCFSSTENNKNWQNLLTRVQRKLNRHKTSLGLRESIKASISQLSRYLARPELICGINYKLRESITQGNSRRAPKEIGIYRRCRTVSVRRR